MTHHSLLEKDPDTEQKTSRFRWSMGQIHRLRTMAGAGHSGAQIALALGKSRSAVLGKAHRLGIKLGGQLPGATANSPKPKIRARRDKNEVRTGLKSLSRTFSIRIGSASGGEKPALNIVARVLDPANAPDGALMLAMMDLEAYHCRWPFEIIEGGETLTRFCGCSTVDETS